MCFMDEMEFSCTVTNLEEVDIAGRDCLVWGRFRDHFVHLVNGRLGWWKQDKNIGIVANEQAI